jgi:hypothetical protein
MKSAPFSLVPLIFLSETGLNVTCMVHCPLAATMVPQSVDWTANGPVVDSEIVTAMLLGLVTVTGLERETVPTWVGGNGNAVGDR